MQTPDVESVPQSASAALRTTRLILEPRACRRIAPKRSRAVLAAAACSSIDTHPSRVQREIRNHPGRTLLSHVGIRLAHAGYGEVGW
jgi:hypothetical protein